VCEQLCTRRPTLTQWLYALLYPKLPVPLSRQLTDHTWRSYAPAMTDIVLAQDSRRQALRRLDDAGIPVVHAVGAPDVLAPPDAVDTLGWRPGADRPEPPDWRPPAAARGRAVVRTGPRRDDATSVQDLIRVPPPAAA
jgi:hypothetical protein